LFLVDNRLKGFVFRFRLLSQ